MNTPKLYRRRFIPNEIIFLKDDKIISEDKKNGIIITKWNVLKKRPDFSHGVSCYFLNEGFKISKFIDNNDNLLFWYCDIINYDYSQEKNEYIINDLLIDIIVQNNGNIKVLDMDEIAEALENRIITEKIACEALKKAHKLLYIIYNDKFKEYTKFITNI